jgi:hypothetical protein
MSVLCLFRHKYYVIIEFGRGQRKVGCKRCHKKWGMHDGLRTIVEWDADFDELYDTNKK